MTKSQLNLSRWNRRKRKRHVRYTQVEGGRRCYTCRVYIERVKWKQHLVSSKHQSRTEADILAGKCGTCKESLARLDAGFCKCPGEETTKIKVYCAACDTSMDLAAWNEHAIGKKHSIRRRKYEIAGNAAMNLLTCETCDHREEHAPNCRVLNTAFHRGARPAQLSGSSPGEQISRLASNLANAHIAPPSGDMHSLASDPVDQVGVLASNLENAHI